MKANMKMRTNMPKKRYMRTSVASMDDMENAEKDADDKKYEGNDGS